MLKDGGGGVNNISAQCAVLRLRTGAAGNAGHKLRNSFMFFPSE